MGQAQSAFENQQRRQQQAGQIFGGLGQATAQLGLGLQGAQQQDVQNLIRVRWSGTGTATSKT